jgi:hypothetical protein
MFLDRVLSGRGLCEELITRAEESYRLCCVAVCDLETSRIGAPYIYDVSHLRVKCRHSMFTVYYAPSSTFPSVPARTLKRAEFMSIKRQGWLTLVGLHVKCPYLIAFNGIGMYLKILVKIANVEFAKSSSMVLAVIHADWQKDLSMLIFTIRNCFAKAPESNQDWQVRFELCTSPEYVSKTLPLL